MNYVFETQSQSSLHATNQAHNITGVQVFIGVLTYLLYYFISSFSSEPDKNAMFIKVRNRTRKLIPFNRTTLSEPYLTGTYPI